MSEHNPETHKGPHLTIANATSRNIRIRWPALGKCDYVLYVYIYICRDKHVNTLAGVSSKHKQTSCWNETNSLSHHLPPKGNVSITLSKRFDPYWTLQQTVQPLSIWQFRAIQLHGLVGGPQVDPGWLTVSAETICKVSQTHTRRVTAIFNIF